MNKAFQNKEVKSIQCREKKKKSKASTSLFGKSKVLKSKGISIATETEVCHRCLIVAGICVALLHLLSDLKKSLLVSPSYRNTLIKLKKKTKKSALHPQKTAEVTFLCCNWRTGMEGCKN